MEGWRGRGNGRRRDNRIRGMMKWKVSVKKEKG
jgi:hypothetical protein